MAGAVGALRASDAPAADAPNVLFIAVDDLRPAVGAYGDKLAVTPNLDRLAQRALLFERAYCQQGLCAPSRASLLTGRRPDAFPEIRGGNETVHYRKSLPDVVTLPQAFKQAGYRTESIGKVNHVYPAIIDPPSWSAPERVMDIPKRDEYLLPTNRTRGFIDAMSKGTATESVDAPDNAYQDGQAADYAIESLQRLKDQKFFLAVGFKRPHLPWTSPAKYWALHDRAKFVPPASAPISAEELTKFPWRYEWKEASGEMRNYTDIPSKGPLSKEKISELEHGYYAAVSYVDAQVGRILDALDRLQLSSRTIIVLWSDNGFHLGESGQWGKKTNTELDTHVVLMMAAPGVTRPGTRTSALVELIDLFPTLTELAHVPAPNGLEGSSLVPLLGEPARPWKRAVFTEFERDGALGRSIRTDRLRYTEWMAKGSDQPVDRELYRSADDPLERDNLIDRPEWKEQQTELAQWLHAGWQASVPAAAVRK